MDDGVDNGFSNGDRREGPTIRPMDLSDHRLSRGVPADKGNRFFDGLHRKTSDLGGIQDAVPIYSLEATSLYPRVGEMRLSVFPE